VSVFSDREKLNKSRFTAVAYGYTFFEKKVAPSYASPASTSEGKLLNCGNLNVGNNLKEL
jgi:hypothetical protein